MRLLIESTSIIVGLIGIYYVYKIFYVRYMNKAINERMSKVKFIDINFVRIGMLFTAVIITFSNIVLSIEAEHEEEIKEYQELIEYLQPIAFPVLISSFDEMVFNDGVVEHIYSEYNSYFGGYYFENYNKIICITFDTPLETIAFLDDANREYKFVKVNYIKLQVLYNMAISHLLDEGIKSVGIDHRDNKIVLYVKPDTIVSPELMYYVDEGLIEVIESSLVGTLE